MIMFTRRLVLGAALAGVTVVSFAGASQAQPWRSAYPELVFAVIPAENASGVTERYGPFVD
jgi:phosphonate transport system substrate-binding protein